MKSKKIGQNRNDESKFAQLLEQSFEKQMSIKPGEACSAIVVNNKNSDYVFIKSDHGPGIIHREELLDDAGTVRINPGERLNVFYFANENGENLYTTKPHGRLKRNILASAFNNAIPLEGKVIKTIKGGYEVQLGEVVAFCPFSHMDVPENEVSGRYKFIVLELSDKKIIVSRKLFQEKEKELQRDIIQKTISEGDILQGKVVSLASFGAFVDIGGIEGLIPLSELSFQRINHPSAVVKQGQELRVKVLSLDWKENKLTLSLKALVSNPWQGELPFSTGSIVTGKIDSIKNFGIFVTLEEGFTGLVPLSETGLPRGKMPDKEFQKGQTIDVLVKTIDREKEKISLSIKDVQEKETRKEFEDYMKNENYSESGSEISSFGRQLMDSLKKKDS